MAEEGARPVQRVRRAAGAILGLFALVQFVNGQPASGSIALAFAAGSLLYEWSGGKEPAQWHRWLAQGMTLALAVVAVLALMAWLPGLGYWAFLFPLVAFSVWPDRLAGILVALFLVLILALNVFLPLGPARHQLIPMLVLATLLTGVFVFLREVKRRQLAPLRRTDTLTSASTREHLDTDLYKEIQRSEREGTHLSLITLAMDPSDNNGLPGADRSAILHNIGRILHENLRAFDNYYRIDDTRFVLILPGMQTAEAMRKAEQLRQAHASLMRDYRLDWTISGGVAGLNVGDDAESLQDHAERALTRAQKQGGNRIQAFSNADMTPQDKDASK
ncbi:GGDEF domain-containing protein [Marinobacteraceae bacterium S3BR75-40.1]